MLENSIFFCIYTRLLGNNVSGDDMIIKFKPYDFEECLMGLPIENWQLVDDVLFDQTDQFNLNLIRPKMLISHLGELNGIIVNEEQIRIKCFTRFDTLFAHKSIPLYFKTVIEHARSLSIVSHKTLGCYLSSVNFDRILYPMLVASDASFVLKSYMKERLIEFKNFTTTGRIQFVNYNEIMYELLLPIISYDHIDFADVEFINIIGDSKFAHFIGYETGKNIRMAIMLPNKRVYRCDKMEALLKKHDFILTRHVRIELLKLYNALIINLRLQLKYKENVNMVFEDVIWRPLQRVLKG